MRLLSIQLKLSDGENIDRNKQSKQICEKGQQLKMII